jgi:hypothetical protein
MSTSITRDDTNVLGPKPRVLNAANPNPAASGPQLGRAGLRQLLSFSAILLIFESGHLSDGGAAPVVGEVFPIVEAGWKAWKVVALLVLRMTPDGSVRLWPSMRALLPERPLT